MEGGVGGVVGGSMGEGGGTTSLPPEGPSESSGTLRDYEG